MQVFGLDERGVDIVGRIDGGLPSLGLPGVAAADYLALAAAAIGVMLVGFAEGLGAAKTYAARHHYEVDANRELLGWARPTSPPGCPAAWWSTAASPRRPSTARPGPAPRCRAWSWPPSPSSPCCLTWLFESLPEATLAALLGVLVFDTLPGLFIGFLVRSCSTPRPSLHRRHRRPDAGPARRRAPAPGDAAGDGPHIGQVRDVLRHTGEDGPLLTVYPTVQQAVDALGQAPTG